MPAPDTLEGSPQHRSSEDAEENSQTAQRFRESVRRMTKLEDMLGGTVRSLRSKELTADWDPTTDARLTPWKRVHHFIRVLAVKLGSNAEVARELCYRLYSMCERKKRAAEALSYNGLVQSWPEVMRLGREGGSARQAQGALFGASEERSES